MKFHQQTQVAVREALMERLFEDPEIPLAPYSQEFLKVQLILEITTQ